MFPIQGGTPQSKLYVDDVFSTYLYDGGTSSPINNGIDLSGKGGLVWIKSRSEVKNHALLDTARGTNKLESNTTNSQAPYGGAFVSFNSNGFTLGASGSDQNTSGQIYTSWTFRKAKNFFDVVTYTGSGTGSSRTLSHNLGVTPGLYVIKATSTTGDWYVGFPSLGVNRWANLNSSVTGFGNNTNYWLSATATTFGPDATGGTNILNVNGVSYVAYLFAHDAASDGLIQCGSYTGNGSATGPTVSLGWEPQWVMIKRATQGSPGAGSWNIFDSMRGITVGGNDWYLQANATTVETGADWLTPTSTGFQLTSTSTEVNGNTSSYVYIAIRRSNKPPTVGTQVFQPTVYTGTNVDNRLLTATIAPDMVWIRQRNDNVLAGMVVADRLRSQPYLLTGSTAAEVDDANAFDQQIVSTTEYGTAFSSMTGVFIGADATVNLNVNTTANNHVVEAFKRATGFFDVVCYTGTGVGRTVSHNLGVVPELMIIKRRNLTQNWPVYCAHLASPLTTGVYLNSSDGSSSFSSWGSTAPTSSVFTVGALNDVNGSADTYVAYLFASLPGISKVGSYTGNGTNQIIDCGFSTGARFILIKRSNTFGDWFVFDSARGILPIGDADPYLRLNASGAESSSADVYQNNSGFGIVQNVTTNLNVTGSTYIYLAIA